MSWRNRALAGGVALGLAALYPLTPLKRISQDRCRGNEAGGLALADIGVTVKEPTRYSARSAERNDGHSIVLSVG